MHTLMYFRQLFIDCTNIWYSDTPWTIVQDCIVWLPCASILAGKLGFHGNQNVNNM